MMKLVPLSESIFCNGQRLAMPFDLAPALEKSNTISLGRAANATLRVDNPHVSRDHAEIAMRNHQLVLVARSQSNRTMIRRQNNPIVVLSGYEKVLRPEDIIELGGYRLFQCVDQNSSFMSNPIGDSESTVPVRRLLEAKKENDKKDFYLHTCKVNHYRSYALNLYQAEYELIDYLDTHSPSTLKTWECYFAAHKLNLKNEQDVCNVVTEIGQNGCFSEDTIKIIIGHLAFGEPLGNMDNNLALNKINSIIDNRVQAKVRKIRGKYENAYQKYKQEWQAQVDDKIPADLYQTLMCVFGQGYLLLNPTICS